MIPPHLSPLPGIPMCPFSKNPHSHSYFPIPRSVFRPLGPPVTASCPSCVALRNRIWIVIHSWRALPPSKKCDSFPLKRQRKRKWNWSLGRDWAPHPWRGTHRGWTGCFLGDPTLVERPKLITSRAFPTKHPGSKEEIPLLCTYFDSSEPPNRFVRTSNTKS